MQNNFTPLLSYFIIYNISKDLKENYILLIIIDNHTNKIIYQNRTNLNKELTKAEILKQQTINYQVLSSFLSRYLERYLVVNPIYNVPMGFELSLFVYEYYFFASGSSLRGTQANKKHIKNPTKKNNKTNNHKFKAILPIKQFFNINKSLQLSKSEENLKFRTYRSELDLQLEKRIQSNTRTHYTFFEEEFINKLVAGRPGTKTGD